MTDNKLHATICQAMLHYLLTHEDWEDEDKPVTVTGWHETPYVPSVCDTCGDQPARIDIYYQTKDGSEDYESVDEEFGPFISRLCER